MCGTKVLVRNDGIVMTEVQFSLSGHRISRPGLDGPPVASRHPSFERTCHVVTDPAGKGHVATGAEPIQPLSDALGADGADALAAAASTLPSASGISSGSPFPASANGSCTQRCPRPRLGSHRSAQLVP